MKSKRWLMLGTALWALPGLASGSGAEAEGGVNPFAGDFGNALWTLVIFGLVVWVLGKFAWGPLLAGLQGREEFIRSSLVDAKKEREAAEQLLADYTEQLGNARAEATAIVDEGRRDAEEVRKRIETEARAEAEKMIARARQEIEIATDTAVKTLYENSAKLATDLASRILSVEIDPAMHERLIRESIAALDQLEKN